MTIEITQPEKIQNLDVLDLSGRIDRMLVEMHGCASAQRNESTEADRARWRQLFDDINTKFGIYKGDPELDLPNYHPIARPVQTAPALETVQNRDIMALTQVLIAVRTQLLFDDAADRSTGFSAAQGTRITAAFEKVGKMLDEYDKNPEVDAPNAADLKP